MLFILIPEPPAPMGLFAILFMLFILPIMELMDPAGRPNEDCCCGGIGRLKPDEEGVALPTPGGGGRENDDADRFAVPMAGRCWPIDSEDMELFSPLPYTGACGGGDIVEVLRCGCSVEVAEDDADAQGLEVAAVVADDQFTDVDAGG